MTANLDTNYQYNYNFQKHPHKIISFFFFFNDPAPTEIYPLSLHDALPIYLLVKRATFRLLYFASGTSGRRTTLLRLGTVCLLINEPAWFSSAPTIGALTSLVSDQIGRAHV